MIFRGVFHAHSKYSYDGKLPLPELCAMLRRRGFHFLLLTEHDDTLDAPAYGRIRSECAALSSDSFLAVPGIEVRCWRTEQEQWHIAALGVTQWISRGPIPDVVGNIHRAGGVAVLLHPHKYSKRIDLAELAAFDGFELWNGKEDGHFAPRLKTLRLAGEIVARSIGPKLYCGHDLHDADGVAPLALEVEAPRLSGDFVLARLRDGAFSLDARGMRFAATSGPSAMQTLRLRGLRSLFATYRNLRRIPLLGSALGAARQAVRPQDSKGDPR